jgi:vacuolar-type H+-ATPase subunit I/STV1
MKLAKITFWIAGIWGLLMIAPLYFIFEVIGQKDPPPINHPGFFYGFVGTALAWQIAFCFIATDPERFRPLMLPSMFEKFSYAIAITTLVLQGRTRQFDLLFAATDLLLGILFVIAYFKTPRS